MWGRKGCFWPASAGCLRPEAAVRLLPLPAKNCHGCWLARAESILPNADSVPGYEPLHWVLVNE